MWPQVSRFWVSFYLTVRKALHCLGGGEGWREGLHKPPLQGGGGSGGFGNPQPPPPPLAVGAREATSAKYAKWHVDTIALLALETRAPAPYATQDKVPYSSTLSFWEECCFCTQAVVPQFYPNPHTT